MAGEAEPELMTQADVLNDFDVFLGNADAPEKEKKETKDDAKGGDDEPESGESESDDKEQDEAESDGDDEQDDDDAESQDARYKVKVDGQEVEVSLDEALAGYSREADYRRRTQAHADEVSKWEASKAETLKADQTALAAEREQYKSVLGIWEKQLSQALGVNEDWETLRRDQPGEWSARMTERYDMQNRLNAIQAEQAKLAEADKSKQEEARKQKASEEARKLVEAVPEWKDAAKWKDDGARIYSYAAKYGITETEVNQITDHRVMRVLHDAARYNALQVNKPAAVRRVETAKPLPPGPATPQSTPASKLVKLRENQARRGDKASTIALFEAELTQSRRA